MELRDPMAAHVTEREALLAAAETVLRGRGYDALRVDDVLARAGLSTRAFYRHFSGKSELFLALFDRETARAADRLRAKVSEATDPEAAVRAWVAATLALAHDARLADRTRLFALEQAHLSRAYPEQIRRCVDAQLAPLVEVIAAGRDRHDFPDADPQADARIIHHVCAGLMTDRLLGLSDESPASATARAAGFALQTLRADGRERRSHAGDDADKEPHHD